MTSVVISTVRHDLSLDNSDVVQLSRITDYGKLIYWS